MLQSQLLNKIFIFMLFLIDLYSLSPLEEPLNMTTSIIIPCHYKHAIYLEETLNSYSQQTVLPTEVVISLSQSKKVSPEIIHTLLTRQWPFKLNLLQHIIAVSEGGNRNRACAASTGQILICSDADDLPHPQRVEIIKYFFDNYNLDSLTHAFTNDPTTWQNLNPAIIPFSIPNYANEGWDHANGAISIARHVWKKFKWRESFSPGMDGVFNNRVYNYYKRKVLISEPIYLYRIHLTSYDYSKYR